MILPSRHKRVRRGRDRIEEVHSSPNGNPSSDIDEVAKGEESLTTSPLFAVEKDILSDLGRQKIVAVVSDHPGLQPFS